MKYAHYDNTGKILGFYDESVHQDIPKPHVELTKEDWQDCLSHPGHRKIDIDSKSVWVIEPTLEELKLTASREVSSFTADARAKLSHDADRYQLAAWNDKAQRAQRVLASSASEADISILQAECDRRGQGETPQALAEKQAAKAQALAMALAIIDGMESTALTAIESKRSEKTLSALVEQFETEAQAQLNPLLGE